MKIFTLVKWEYSTIDGEGFNTWEDATFYINIKEANKAMVASISHKLNLLYENLLNDDDTLDIDPYVQVEISLYWACVRARKADVENSTDELCFYKFQIFEGEV